MQLNLYIILTITIIIYNQCELTSAKSLIGQNIRPARFREFPYIGALIKINPSQPRQISRFCTATIITSHDALTAEHCMIHEAISNLQVSLGSNDYRRGERYNIDWWISYDTWAEHLEIPNEVKTNDIAVIRLSGTVSASIRPIPFSNQTINDLIGLEVSIAGWGTRRTGDIPVIMDSARLKILSYQECSERLARQQGRRVKIHSRMFCTAATPFILLSHGDSGDPIIYNNQIIGVSSGIFQEQQFHPDKVNIHCTVDYYKTFILDIVNNF